MDWSKDKSLKLLDGFKRRRVLWDPNHKDYYRRRGSERAKAWQEISEEVNKPVDQCKIKFKKLLSGYRKEKRKLMLRNRYGKTRYVSKWFALDAFKFFETRRFPDKMLKPSEESENLEMAIVYNNYDDMMRDVIQADQVEQVGQPIVTTYQIQPTSSISQSPQESFHDDVVDDDDDDDHEDDDDDDGDESNLSILERALELLKEKYTNIEKNTSKPNEINTFFDFVATKMYKYPKPVRVRVENAILNVLMKADTGTL